MGSNDILKWGIQNKNLCNKCSTWKNLLVGGGSVAQGTARLPALSARTLTLELLCKTSECHYYNSMSQNERVTVNCDRLTYAHIDTAVRHLPHSANLQHYITLFAINVSIENYCVVRTVCALCSRPHFEAAGTRRRCVIALTNKLISF